jgi:DnaJ-domain-containing protein 1
MSVTRKIVEGARSGLNSLLDKVLADDTPLSGVERDELDAEQARRAEARRRAGGARRPEDNPRARWAGAGEEAARQRRNAAESREQRIRAGRAAQRRADDAAREEAWQKFQADARRQSAADGARASSAGPGRGAGAGAGPRAGGASSGQARRPMGFGRSDKLAKYYKVLDLPYGADFDQVKASYRKLMRKYHPDMHTQTPQKAKAATELTMQVTEAYNELEKHLTDGPNKKT